MMNRNISIGRLLRELRRERGLTQDELAHVAGVSWRTVALAEKGYAPKTRAARERIACALGVDERELFGETSEGVGTP